MICFDWVCIPFRLHVYYKSRQNYTELESNGWGKGQEVKEIVDAQSEDSILLDVERYVDFDSVARGNNGNMDSDRLVNECCRFELYLHV